jgi:hypothetical protein
MDTIAKTLEQPYVRDDNNIAPRAVQDLFEKVAAQTARHNFLDGNNNKVQDPNEIEFDKGSDGKIYFGMSTQGFKGDLPPSHSPLYFTAVYDPKTRELTSQDPVDAIVLRNIIVNGQLDQKTVRPVDLTPKKLDPNRKG